jgi:hypothetical protein
MLARKPVLLYQESELPPCLDETVIDGRMFLLAGAGPASIGQLLLEDFPRFRQLPQAMNRPDILPSEIAPYEISERLVSRRQKGRQGIELQLLSPLFHELSSACDKQSHEKLSRFWTCSGQKSGGAPCYLIIFLLVLPAIS